jgi:hypothetical protein
MPFKNSFVEMITTPQIVCTSNGTAIIPNFLLVASVPSDYHRLKFNVTAIAF